MLLEEALTMRSRSRGGFTDCIRKVVIESELKSEVVNRERLARGNYVEAFESAPFSDEAPGRCKRVFYEVVLGGVQQVAYASTHTLVL